MNKPPPSTVFRNKKKIGRPEALLNREFHGHKFLIQQFLFGSENGEGQSNLKLNLKAHKRPSKTESP